MIKKNFFKYLTSLCFLALIVGFYIFSIYPAGAGVKSYFIGLSLGQNVVPSHAETFYNDRFPAKSFFVSLNGGFQRMMGVRYTNGIVKLDNGYISYTIDESDVEQLAMNTVELSRVLEEKGIPLLYVNAPFKINMDENMLPAGMHEYSNENTDNFLEILEDNKVDVLDLRVQMKLDGRDHYSSFFATDHHWTPETGMWAVGKISEHLSKADPSFAVDEAIYDLSNYHLTQYKDILLGSSGRRTGPLYAGRDDMTLITPKFDSSLRFFAERENLERTGSFSETLIFHEHLHSDDPYYPFTYLTYCGSDYALLELENRSAEEGLEIKSTAKRIMLIKDSFSEVVIPFLSLSYDDLYCIDMRSLFRPLMPFIEQFDPDAVVILYNGGAYSDNEIMFDFFNESVN